MTFDCEEEFMGTFHADIGENVRPFVLLVGI